MEACNKCSSSESHSNGHINDQPSSHSCLNPAKGSSVDSSADELLKKFLSDAQRGYQPSLSSVTKPQPPPPQEERQPIAENKQLVGHELGPQNGILSENEVSADDLMRQLLVDASLGRLNNRSTQHQHSIQQPAKQDQPALKPPTRNQQQRQPPQRVLRMKVPKASVTNNCHRKQRDPLTRWWLVTQLQTTTILEDDDEFLIDESNNFFSSDLGIPLTSNEKQQTRCIEARVDSESSSSTVSGGFSAAVPATHLISILDKSKNSSSVAELSPPSSNSQQSGESTEGACTTTTSNDAVNLEEPSATITTSLFELPAVATSTTIQDSGNHTEETTKEEAGGGGRGGCCDGDSVDLINLNSGASSNEVFEEADYEQQAADNTDEHCMMLSPLPETPVFTHITDILINTKKTKKSLSLRQYHHQHYLHDECRLPPPTSLSDGDGDAIDYSDNKKLYKYGAESHVAFRRNMPSKFDVRKASYGSLGHRGEAGGVIPDVDEDIDEAVDEQYQDSTVLVQASSDRPPVTNRSQLSGVSKKRCRYAERVQRASRAFGGTAGAVSDNLYEASRYIHRSLLNALAKEFGLHQPDDFMLRCWKKIVSARFDQNILILGTSPSSTGGGGSSAAAAAADDSLAALCYLVPLISQRCLCELNDVWRDGIGLQPKIAVICPTAVGAAAIARTCKKLLPHTSIALAIGLETSGHEESRRERRSLLEGAQIIVASVLGFNRYMSTWRATSDFDEVRVIVVEQASFVLSAASSTLPCELLEKWKRVALGRSPPSSNNGFSDLPQLILVDKHSPAVGTISKFMQNIRGEQIDVNNKRLAIDNNANNTALKINSWIRVLANPLDKLLFDNWQWEFVETAMHDTDAADAAEKYRDEFLACITDIVSAHAVPEPLAVSSGVGSSNNRNNGGGGNLMLACYHGADRVELFLKLFQEAAKQLTVDNDKCEMSESEQQRLLATRFPVSHIKFEMPESEQRVLAMRWLTSTTSKTCWLHLLLVEDGCSLKTLPNVPVLRAKETHSSSLSSWCEAAVFIDLPRTQQDFTNRLNLLASLPAAPSHAAGSIDEFKSKPARVLYQCFDYRMQHELRGIVFMLNYAQNFLGNASSVLQHSNVVQLQLRELTRQGLVCRQFMLSGQCTVSGLMKEEINKISSSTTNLAAMSAQQHILPKCLLRHSEIGVSFADNSNFLRRGQRFRFQLMWILSPVEIVGHLEGLMSNDGTELKLNDKLYLDESYEALCEALEKEMQNRTPVTADTRNVGELLIAEYNYSVFRCRLVCKKNFPHTIVIEDFDCTLSMDMAASLSADGPGAVMRNGYIQLPVKNIRLFPLPRELSPRFSPYKCFKVNLYMPTMLPAEPAGLDLSWFPSAVSTANTFFQRNKHCQIYAEAKAFTNEWTCIDDIVASLTLHSVKQTTTCSYRQFMIDNDLAQRSISSTGVPDVFPVAAAEAGTA